MNLQLYNRPYSSQNLRKNLNLALSSTSLLSTSRPQTHLVNFSELGQERLQISDRTFKNDSQNADFYNLPDSSQYNIQLYFPERPKTSHLSGLTLRENEKSLVSGPGYTHINTLRSLGLSQSQGMMKLPSDQDFTKILTKLEMVSSNHTAGHRRIILNDSDSVEILLEAGETQYFSINSKGKKPPLVCFLKRNKGKVISYLSKVHSEPSKNTCEIVGKQDSFQMGDINIRFKIDAIYLAIEAVTESIFTLTITFGQKIEIKKTRNLKITQEEQEIINKPEANFKISIPKQPKPTKAFSKDFIKLNIELPRKKLCEQDLKTKRYEYKIRRDSVLVKKKKNLIDKKERTLNIINKRIIKMEEERREREEREELMILQEKQKMWISLIHFSISMQVIRKIREVNRQRIFTKIKRSIAAYKLQRMYKIKIGFHIGSVLILRTLTVLRMYHIHAKRLFYRTQVKCIKESAVNHILPHAFKKFTDMVIYIQRNWHEYAHRKKLKWEVLVNMWNSTIEELMLKVSKQHTTRKRQTKETKKFSAISIAIRNTVLQEHILETKKNYVKTLREFKAKNVKNIDKAIQEMNTMEIKGKRRRLRSYPFFTILPTKNELIKLIEKALKASSNNLL